MAALLKNKDASERERLIISIADDATSPRPFDAAGWQADTPVAIVRGDGFIPLSASGHSRRSDSRQSLRVYPDEQTCSKSAGMSQRCHEETGRAVTARITWPASRSSNRIPPAKMYTDERHCPEH